MTQTDRRRPNNPSFSSENLHALVVDDDDNYRFYVSTLMERIGFNVTSASDGAEAISKLREQAFDVAVVDMEMPRMSGLDVVREIRKDDSASIYTVMLTGRADQETK